MEYVASFKKQKKMASSHVRASLVPCSVERKKLKAGLLSFDVGRQVLCVLIEVTLLKEIETFA
jgi:hypothetical protein